MNEIMVRDEGGELSVADVKRQVVKIQELMRDLMTEGEHFGGSFPGDTKKNLLKPGADKLCFMFRLRPEFEQRFTEHPGGHREVHTKCELYHMGSGVKVAEGVGSCSTMETKYRWRNEAKKCPSCGKEAIIKGKEEFGGGWLCYKKKDGCGAKFTDDDLAITEQKSGKVENPDIADVYNTVTKISKKRAYVDATITATAASDIFTQDAEDFAAEPGDLHGDGPGRWPAGGHTEGPVQRQVRAAQRRSEPPRKQQASPQQQPAGSTDKKALEIMLDDALQDKKINAQAHATWKKNIAGATESTLPAMADTIRKLAGVSPAQSAPTHSDEDLDGDAAGDGELFEEWIPDGMAERI